MNPQATTSERTTATAIQERYAARIKARLARPALDVRDARDGILDCFIATYHAGVAGGLQSILGVHGSEDEVSRVTTAIFRRKLAARGGSFDAPTVEALTLVKDEVDHELHVHELPAELRGVHDQVCALLLAKTDGLLAHDGDRSAMRVTASSAPPVSTSAATITAGAAVAPVAPVAPVIAVAPPTITGGVALTRPVVDHGVRVTVELRAALATCLEGLAAQAVAGATTASLDRGLARAARLIATLADFDEAV